jgi:hypothetical protein
VIEYIARSHCDVRQALGHVGDGVKRSGENGTDFNDRDSCRRKGLGHEEGISFGANTNGGNDAYLSYAVTNLVFCA